MRKGLGLCFAALLTLMANSASADPFVNGGFEDGTTNGWTTGEGYRGFLPNSVLTTASVLPGGSLYTAPAVTRSSIIAAGTLDPVLGSLLGSTVYSGAYSYRSEDTTSGGYTSAISQQVANYTDSNIYFAWKAVLQNGGHSEDESAEMLITLTDDTTGKLLVSRVYNAGNGGGGVDARFSEISGIFYTTDWQIEQISIDPSLQGHDFTLSLLAADCDPTGHFGYVYLDGFSAIAPAALPEPASMSLIGIGACCFLASRRRRTKSTAEYSAA